MQSREGKYGDLHWVSLSFMLLETGLRFTKLSLDLTGCCCRFLYLPYTAFLSVQWILYFTKTSNEVRKVFKRRPIFSMPKEIKNSTNINRYTFICVNKKKFYFQNRLPNGLMCMHGEPHLWYIEPLCQRSCSF